MNFFVKRSSTVEVEVWAWQQDGNIEASPDKSEIPKSLEDQPDQVHQLKFWFRKPSYSDSNLIIRQSQMTGDDNAQIDVTGFQDVILRSLLTDWSLDDGKGGKVSVTPASISELEPALARAAVAGVLKKIRF